MSKRIAFVAATAALAVGLAVQAATASPKKHAAARSSPSARRDERRARHPVREPGDGVRDAEGAEGAGAARQPLLGRQQVGRARTRSRPTRPTRAIPPTTGRSTTGSSQYAHTYNIPVVFSILFTPSWANGGQARTVAPTNMLDLQNFAYAAAERYSGLWTPPSWQQDAALGIGDGAAPEGQHVDGLERAEQPDLAHAAVQEGRQEVGDPERGHVREDLQRGLQRRAHAGLRPAARASRSRAASPARRATTRRRRPRPSVDPLSFLSAAKAAGMKTFDVYAHHPYCGRRQRAAELRAEGQGRAADPARQHQHAAGEDHAALRAEAPLDHRVRLPDEPARQDDLRRRAGRTRRSTCRRPTRSRARTRAST